MSVADRMNINQQMEHLQSKYVGTGHPDISKYEWASNMHRDSLAAYIAQQDIMTMNAVADNESVARVRARFLDKMIQPCGPPPEKKDDD